MENEKKKVESSNSDFQRVISNLESLDFLSERHEICQSQITFFQGLFSVPFRDKEVNKRDLVMTRSFWEKVNFF